MATLDIYHMSLIRSVLADITAESRTTCPPHYPLFIEIICVEKSQLKKANFQFRTCNFKNAELGTLEW